MNNDHNNELHPESEARLESYIRATQMAVPKMRVTKDDIIRNTVREGRQVTPSPYTRVIMSYQTLIKVLAPITAVVLIGGIALSRNMQNSIPATDSLDPASEIVSETNQKNDSTISTPITTPKQSNAVVDSIVDDILADSKTEVRDAKLALSDYQSSFSTSTALDAALNTDYAN
jgi:hypothetical protein